MKTLEERFWEKVDKTEGCWVWTACRKQGGYGKIWDGENVSLAHRVSFAWANGSIPEGMLVCHKCDVFAEVGIYHKNNSSQRQCRKCVKDRSVEAYYRQKAVE